MLRVEYNHLSEPLTLLCVLRSVCWHCSAFLCQRDVGFLIPQLQRLAPNERLREFGGLCSSVAQCRACGQVNSGYGVGDGIVWRRQRVRDEAAQRIVDGANEWQEESAANCWHVVRRITDDTLALIGLEERPETLFVWLEAKEG